MDHINTDIEFDDQLIPEESKGQEKTASSQDAFIPKEGNAFAEEETTTEETTASIENIEAGEFLFPRKKRKKKCNSFIPNIPNRRFR